jgi:hypothetical protein
VQTSLISLLFAAKKQPATHLAAEMLRAEEHDLRITVKYSLIL